ncbi:site-specific integrase, partial [Bacillus sp. EB600]|uniref:site-specific integrase n=1 Tax=Bacillus sp. EB600 TaxID=2806345 RepID=UPI00210AC448
TRLSKKQVQNRISHYGLKARLEGVRCSPHTFRHTFAKMCVQSGANVFELQQILGHSSLEMVRNYVNLFSSEIKESHNKFSPLKGLSTRV